MALDNLTIFQTSEICLLNLRMKYPLSNTGCFKLREKVNSALELKYSLRTISHTYYILYEFQMDLGGRWGRKFRILFLGRHSLMAGLRIPFQFLGKKRHQSHFLSH